ncbi:MAG: hypothetical protein ABFS21_02995 [Actinomycetota bacterium]
MPRQWIGADGRRCPQSGIAGVIAIGDGFVALGEDEEDGAVWFSSDALNWDLVETSTAGTLFHQPSWITQHPADERLVALNYYGVWASPDGTHWTQVHEYDGYSIPTHPDGTAAWFGDRLIAADPDTGIWSSGDGGATWARHDWTDDGLPGAPGTFVEHEGRLFAVGDSIWIGTPLSP